MNINKIYAYGSTAAVILAVITGLFLSGTPANQRQYRFDEERVADLRRLTYHIESYRNAHQQLPDSLEALAGGRGATIPGGLDVVPTDPETGAIYMYVVVSENSYRLCADFNLASEHDGQATFWGHDAGYQCYEIILPEVPTQDT